METTTVQYPGYTIEIPETLIKPFRILSTVMKGMEVEDPIPLLSEPISAEIIEACIHAVSTSIGKEFAHDAKISNALSQWAKLSKYEKTLIITEASDKIEPFDHGLKLQTGIWMDDV
ncbi:MAG: hypothetical protein EpisKO_04060 [Epibacterium sp.]